ncbi:MAG: heparan-alpha-glucosaminide N-acetyltransferase domain-containing protein [Armatimonadetes bacterium]|nr:heparan-alpha-glucosaminide N-acetyltransferase domain-containing protein [Armatimonadota bacterium]
MDTPPSTPSGDPLEPIQAPPSETPDAEPVPSEPSPGAVLVAAPAVAELVAVAEPETPPAPAPAPGGSPVRLHSLDAFRGITVLLMLLVNNCSLDTFTPTQLTHAPWKGGIYLADLVFPWFLFCVGVAMPFSAASFRRKGLPAWRYDVKLLTRAAMLFLLGCLVESSIARRPVLALGVLQLIALAGLAAGLVADVPVSRRLVMAGLILAGYGAALVYVPIPVYGSGLSGEHENLVASLNNTYLAPIGLPGLPSVVPTAALVLLGTIAGSILARRREPNLPAAGRLVLFSLALIALGAFWNLRLPYSKALWSPSYILFAGGLGSLALCLLYIVVDGTGWRRWFTPLLAAGANAIAAYVGSILLKVWVLQAWTLDAGPGKRASVTDWFLSYCVARVGRADGGWVHTITFVGICWLALLVLYRKRIFLRL